MTTQEILEAARAARSALGLSSGEVRRAALLGMAEALCSPARQQAILDAVAQSGFRLSDFDAVCGRGGLYRPLPSGPYAVNDRVLHDVETAPYGEHPSNLGAYLARRIGDMVGVPAFFVDPVCVDELTEVAH